MTLQDIVDLVNDIISMLGDYHNPPHREMLLDPMFYGLLEGRFGQITRQHHVPIYGSRRPKRIDFRFGGNNPIVIELVVRPPTGGSQLYGGPNKDELGKLCRVSATKARLRALLLVDLYHSAISKDNLIRTYAAVNAGPGRFTRKNVRVIYVHKSMSYNFIWKPIKL